MQCTHDAPELSADYVMKACCNICFVRGRAPKLVCITYLSKPVCVCAELCEELPKDGLRFTALPTEKDVTFFPTPEALVPTGSEARKRPFISPYAVSKASPDKSFLLSINALMVNTGFCHETIVMLPRIRLESDSVIKIQ